MRQIHALTPGDHFSPRTGSAIATVVDGLASHTVPRATVLVAQGTYRDRYVSADAIEYPLRHSPHGASRTVRAMDIALGRAALPRPWARRVYRQPLVEQDTWSPSYVIGHNAPQLMPLVNDRHASVLYVHNDLLTWYSDREANTVLRNVHRIICVSAYTAAQTAKVLHPALRQRIRVVHNGVDVAQYALPRAAPGYALRVGFIGRVIPRKGAHVLLDALALLQREDIDVDIVGSAGFDANTAITRYEAELRASARRIPGRVKFAPFQARHALPEILSTFDVTVVPSVEPEAFALTVLEGMAAGSAVIASAIGGIPEASGGAAQLVQPGNAAELAAVLDGLADNRALVTSMAERGRERARQMTWEQSSAALVRALQ